MINQRARKGIFAVVATIALSLSLSACATASTSDDAGGYPPEVRENFVNACSAQPGATTETCEQCFDAIEAEFTFDEFVALEEAVVAGTASEEDTERLNQIVATCG